MEATAGGICMLLQLFALNKKNKVMSTTSSNRWKLSWNRLPVIIKAIITGVLVAAAGTLPWAYLVRLNIDHLPSVPWSIIPTLIYLWFFWKYVNGKGWPQSTAAIRKKLLRANELSGDIWGAAIMAGILGLISLVLFSGLLSRMIRMPQQDASGVENVPVASLFFMVVMGSIVAGVTEESAFRGYMQKPIEQRHGPLIAILVTGIMFGLLHYSHPETTIELMPFYFFVATIYGMLAYLTNSILPGIILHTVGDIFGGLDLLLRGQSEWQTSIIPKPLIWETGPDTSFWFSFTGLIAVGTITVWAYMRLAKEVRSTSQTHNNL